MNPPRQIRLCQSYRRSIPTPVLTLEGVWFKAAGFSIGDLVQVTPNKGKITITILEKWKSERSKPA